MKKILFTLFIGASILASCGSDCELTELDEIIIGDWTFIGSDISFNADGTMDDPDNAFEAELNGIPLLDKNWELEGDTLLLIRCSNQEPPGALTSFYEILEYDCDEIKANNFLDITFKRK